MRALTVLCAVSASTMGGLALSFAWMVRQSGAPHRRFLRWLGPLWAFVAFWHAAIWTITLIDRDFVTTRWFRPVTWAAFALPALSLWLAQVEDKRIVEQQGQIETAMAATVARAEGTLNGEP